jgi:hypothetical protein
MDLKWGVKLVSARLVSKIRWEIFGEVCERHGQAFRIIRLTRNRVAMLALLMPNMSDRPRGIF